jgi:carboxyl-terminal processing protease
MKKTLLGIFTVIMIAGLVSFNTLGDKYFEISRNLDIYATLFRELNTHYVDGIDPEVLVEESIKAMLESLDPYTTYIPASMLEAYRTSTTGEYGGIGAIVGRKNGINTVIMPYKGFPAYEAGLKIGDLIFKIDGKDLKDKSSSDISELLKGNPNTPVKLAIKRFNRKDTFEVTLNRAKITIDNIPYYGLLEDQIGYIRLSDFTTNAGKEVNDALQALKKQGAENIILDLRGNPGGLLNEAINVANVFVPKGQEIVSTKGKVTTWDQVYTAPVNAVDTDIPLVVLTNSGTASASEIVSGVVQDYDRGVLIGKRTFGKGLVQATRPLPYDAQLKVTTAKYYIPSGRSIQAIDYAKKNEDGSVAKIPDSLMVAYKTRAGRTVYDGGGIAPDIEVEVEYYSHILLSLVNQSIFFDYATKYYYDHPTIVSPSEFQLTDAEYDEFLSWVKEKDFELKGELDVVIKNLELAAKNEQYYNGISSQLTALKSKIEQVKSNYLIEFKKEAKTLLQEDIISRYYLYPGVLEASLNYDPTVTEAISVLNDQPKYNKLLNK